MSRQTVDEKTGDLTVKQALTKAAQAAVDRLEVLFAFKRMTAPFDGIVTARNTDVGALIGAKFERRPCPVGDFRCQQARGSKVSIRKLCAGVKINAEVQIAVPDVPARFTPA